MGLVAGDVMDLSAREGEGVVEGAIEVSGENEDDSDMRADHWSEQI